jgi:hypothetical protein
MILLVSAVGPRVKPTFRTSLEKEVNLDISADEAETGEMKGPSLCKYNILSIMFDI